MTATNQNTARRTRHAFTLTELLIVIGIIVLIIALAVPAFRAMTGGRSVDAAQNQLAAVLGHARAEAIGLQQMRGVLFYLDPATDRVNAVLVEEGSRPATPPAIPPDVYLDAVADRDPVALPVGVGLQMVDNAGITTTATTSTRGDDGYVGFNNQVAAGGGNTPPLRAGGVILFDGQGRMVNKRYGFATHRPMSRTVTEPTPTRLGELLGFKVGTAASADYSVLRQSVTGPGAAENDLPPRSQLGFVLYDAEPFRNLDFTPGDSQFDDSQAGAYSRGSNEFKEEEWLDQNATPVLINRYNGSLIRGE